MHSLAISVPSRTSSIFGGIFFHLAKIFTQPADVMVVTNIKQRQRDVDYNLDYDDNYDSDDDMRGRIALQIQSGSPV